MTFVQLQSFLRNFNISPGCPNSQLIHMRKFETIIKLAAKWHDAHTARWIINHFFTQSRVHPTHYSFAFDTWGDVFKQFAS